VNYLVTVNDQFASLYSGIFPACDPVVIGNFVDPQNIDKYHSPLRAIVGAKPTDKIILYHGSMRSLRHLRELAGASIHLPQHWKMVFMGAGPLRSELEQISHRPFFLDPAPYDELFKWLAGADVGAILYEDFGLNQHYCSPNKLYEYIGCGIPILTTDIPTLTNYSETLDCGFIIEKPTEYSIANVVAGISVEQLNKASDNCKIIAKQFSWEREKQKIFKIISDT
jgi:glycosyltransferase involved in cell wall biosynthesis